MIRLLVFITALCFYSCVSDVHKDTNMTCEIHHTKMHKAVVPINYGLHKHGFNTEFPNARRHVCGGCVVRPPKLAVIAICSICTKGYKSNR